MKYFFAGLLVVVLAIVGNVGAQEFTDMGSIRALARNGDREKALERLDELIAADEDNVQARFLKGLLLLEEDDAAAAQQVFAEIARLFPRLPEAFNNLAAIYAMEGEYERARQALLSALANAPDYATARANLGDLYIKLAVDAYRKAIELNPEDPASNAKLKVLEQMFIAGG